MSETKRLYYVDWLRIIVVLLLIPFHTARIFDVWENNYVKDAELSMPLSYLITFLFTWNMPLLFLLAGYASRYALEVRSPRQYLGERFRRLLVPLVFGVLVIVPPQAYVARLQQGVHDGSYWAFLVDYFRIRGDLTGYTGLFTPAHLWFILYLVVYVPLALPLFLHIRKNPPWTAWLARECERRGAIFSLAVPLGVAGALPDISGKNPFYYFVLLLMGFVLAGDARFSDAVDRHKKGALWMGMFTMILTIGLLGMGFRFTEKSAADVLFYLVRTFGTWFWVIALLGYGKHYLNFTNALHRYANEASYPFYILHQTVIMVFGYWVVQWHLGVYGKFAVISMVSLVLTLALYEIGVKRTSMTRFLFGMSRRKAA